MAAGRDIARLGLRYVGYAYSQGPTRTTGADHYFDCSGFTYFLVKTLGGGPVDWEAQSHLQALNCRAHNTLVSIDTAIRTPGALLFEGPNHAYIGGYGIPGHVAVSLGDGRTVEAMGHRWGTCIGGTVGRGWSNAGFVPGFNYSNLLPVPTSHPTTPSPQETEMAGLQVVTYKAAGFSYPWAALDTVNRKLAVYKGGKVTWHGGTPASGQHVGTRDPYFYSIPGNEPVIAMDELRQTASGCDFVVYGFAGGEYLGQLHK